MKIKVWPNGLGAEVTYKGRRVSCQEHGRSGFAVAIRARGHQPGDKNTWYGKNPDTTATWKQLAEWGYAQWKAGVPSLENAP